MNSREYLFLSIFILSFVPQLQSHAEDVVESEDVPLYVRDIRDMTFEDVLELETVPEWIEFCEKYVDANNPEIAHCLDYLKSNTLEIFLRKLDELDARLEKILDE